MAWCVETINMGAHLGLWVWERWGPGKGCPSLCEEWKWGGSFSRLIEGPFLLGRVQAPAEAPTLCFIVWRQERDLLIIFKLTASCHYLFPEGQSERVFGKAKCQPTTSPTPLLHHFPTTPPCQTPAQPNHLWLPFLMTNFNALIRKHLHVHSSQTPYGARDKICFIFMKAKPWEREVFWIPIVVPTLGEE